MDTKRLKELVKTPKELAISIVVHLGVLMPDKLYLKMLYPLRTGYKLNLQTPKTFGEKLQWLKLYDRRPEYTTMVDKILAKEYVASIIGDEYIIPTIATYDSPDDIDFDALPDQFVLKCNHDSGGLCICKDKTKLNFDAVRKGLGIGLKHNYYLQGREWPYKNVKRRIIAEKLLEYKESEDIPDYKFYCFNGVPTYCQLITDRRTEEKIDFYDMDWNRIEGMVGLNMKVKNSSIEHSKPVTFEVMKKNASILSKGIPFSRIDFYELDGHCFFGEITFFPASGMGSFRPSEYNYILGEKIKIDN